MILEQAIVLPLNHWENFYVIVGSSGGALTGLQFVVMSLIADKQSGSGTQEIRAFGTPTVVHFCAALLISAILSAPWRGLFSVSIVLGLCGAAGVGYVLRVIGHARRQTGYAPDAEDWLWYAALPLGCYAALAGAAILLLPHPDASLFVIAAVNLSLLFLGIRNSWDTITYVATKGRRSEPADAEKADAAGDA